MFAKVMVIDGDPGIAALLKRFLEQSDFQVVELNPYLTSFRKFTSFCHFKTKKLMISTKKLGIPMCSAIF